MSLTDLVGQFQLRRVAAEPVCIQKHSLVPRVDDEAHRLTLHRQPYMHSPAGHSASEFTHPTDAPSPAATAAPPAGGKATVVIVIATDRRKVLFANPS